MREGSRARRRQTMTGRAGRTSRGTSNTVSISYSRMVTAGQPRRLASSLDASILSPQLSVDYRTGRRARRGEPTRHTRAPTSFLGWSERYVSPMARVRGCGVAQPHARPDAVIVDATGRDSTAVCEM